MICSHFEGRHQPSERDQIAVFRPLICAGARRNPRPEIRNPKSENPKPEIPRSQTRNPQPDTYGDDTTHFRRARTPHRLP